MNKINNNLSIIPVKSLPPLEESFLSLGGRTPSYLDHIIDDIIILNWISNQFRLKKNERDFIIKFKRFIDKEMLDFNDSIFKLENRGKWYSFIFTLN